VTAVENEAEAVVYHVVVLDLGSLLRDIEFTGDFAPAACAAGRSHGTVP